VEAITSLKLLHQRTRGFDMNHSNSIRVLFIYIGICLICVCPARGQETVEVGSSCTGRSKLPQALLCAEGYVIDCLNATNVREALYCAASELQKADNELNRLYQRVLKNLDRPNDEDADYHGARRALTEGQRAWVKFKKADCEVPGYLNLKGSSQSNEMIACELKNTKNRIADLNTYFVP